jgi:murein tripeptide amidase MpaA
MNRTQIIYSLIVVVTLAVIAGVVLWSGVFEAENESLVPENQPTVSPKTSSSTTGEQANMQYYGSSTIGQSVEGRNISVHTFGNGDNHLLFVGGIHGGYEWNSVVLAYNLIDYLQANPNEPPKNIKVSIIPSANPDGVHAVTGKTGPISAADVPADADPGGPQRFNANGVDLNRNFACRWQPKSFWRGQKVNAGTSAFSEPEARVIRNFVQSHSLSAGIFFHSAAGAVYGAACNGQVGPQTKQLLNTYAQAANYRAVERFDAYPITGDVESWLTKLGIPAVSVELSNHTDTEWQKNLAGIKAVIELHSQ